MRYSFVTDGCAGSAGFVSSIGRRRCLRTVPLWLITLFRWRMAALATSATCRPRISFATATNVISLMWAVFRCVLRFARWLCWGSDCHEKKGAPASTGAPLTTVWRGRQPRCRGYSAFGSCAAWLAVGLAARGLPGHGVGALATVIAGVAAGGAVAGPLFAFAHVAREGVEPSRPVGAGT